MDRAQIRAQLLQRAEEAKLQTDAILNETDMTEETLHRHLRSYVLCRFGLDETVEENNILALARISIARSAELTSKGIKVSDISPGCSGISSETAKKALMLVTLQKALGIKLDGGKAAYIETLEGLARAVFEQVSMRSGSES